MSENYDHICGHDLYRRAVNAGVILSSNDINFLNSPDLVNLEKLESKYQVLLEDQANLIEEKDGLLTEKYKATLDKLKILLENDKNSGFNNLFIKNLDREIRENDEQNDNVKFELSENEEYLLILEEIRKKRQEIENFIKAVEMCISQEQQPQQSSNLSQSFREDHTMNDSFVKALDNKRQNEQNATTIAPGNYV